MRPQAAPRAWLSRLKAAVAGICAHILTGIPAFASASDRLARIEAKLDRLSDDVRFIKSRMTTYVGQGVALTWLADESPFFVNAGDVGSPGNLINGGVYEEDNIEVLLSYLRPHSLCIDVGANLGLFSVKFAQRLRAPGRVLAFELHPMLCDWMERNLVINGLDKMVEVHNFGLYDRSGAATFNFRPEHLGAGHVDTGPALGRMAIPGRIRLLDDVIAVGTAVDLIKIDVEHHELPVLRGMRRVLHESPDVVILFEKLSPNAGDEQPIRDYLAEFGFDLFGVMPGAGLQPLSISALHAWSGYVLAARAASVGSTRRSRFSVYPAQMWRADTHGPMPADSSQLSAVAPENGLLFYGPYWSLRRGRWRITYTGEITGLLNLVVSERHGQPVARLQIGGGVSDGYFVADNDLLNFECAGYAGSPETRVVLERLEFERLD